MTVYDKIVENPRIRWSILGTLAGVFLVGGAVGDCHDSKLKERLDETYSMKMLGEIHTEDSGRNSVMWVNSGKEIDWEEWEGDMGSAYSLEDSVKTVPQSLSRPESLEGLNRGKSPLVVLDAGHGNGNDNPVWYDPGAVHNGVEEARTVMDQVQFAWNYLKDKGYHIVFTRIGEEDQISLKERIAGANEIGADFYVSVHLNASDTNANAFGTRIYTYPESVNGAKLGGEIYGEIIKHRIGTEVEQNYDGMKTRGNLAVLNQVKCPSVLVESAFISNPKDAVWTQEHSREIGEAIGRGIDNYFNGPN